MVPRYFAHANVWKAMFKYVVAPALIVGMAVALMLRFPSRSSATEANAAMLADPPPTIDGQRAYGYLNQIVEIGPRTAGSEANARQRKLVFDHFEKAGGKVQEQFFRALHPHDRQAPDDGQSDRLVEPGSARTRRDRSPLRHPPHPDQEFDPNRQNLPFVGANDGASGVALLMEIANHLSKLETHWGVDLVLFDGEELVFGNDPRIGEYFLGSEEFARVYRPQEPTDQDAVRGGHGPRYGRRTQLHIKVKPTSWKKHHNWSEKSGASRGH